MQFLLHRPLLAAWAFFLMMATLPAQGLRFQGDTRDVYFSALEAVTLDCGANCGPMEPCWANLSVTNTVVSLYAKYEGPGPCTFCGCCMEAAAFATGVVRVVLYVNPETGTPLSKHNGGQPVFGNDIPKFSKLELRERSGVNACIGSSCDHKCRANAVMTFGDFTAVESKERPICDDVNDRIDWTHLSGDGAEFATFIYAFGKNCTNVSSHIDLNNASVWVPVNALVPSQPKGAATTDAKTENQKITISNETGERWTDLHLRVYDPNGEMLDSLFISELRARKKLEWIVPGAPSYSSIRFTARSDSATIHPMRSADRAAYFLTSPVSPHILLQDSDSTGTKVELVMHSGTTYERCRPGELSVNLNTDESLGWQIVDVSKPAFSGDEFDGDSLSSFWTVEIPTAPHSYASLTERSGFLRVSATQAYGGADYWEGANFGAPRIFQNVVGDWTLETKMEFNPTDGYEGAGLFINGERLAERYSTGGEQLVYCLGPVAQYSGTTTYFRVIKQADSLRGYWSADGKNWQFGGAIEMTPSCVGVHVVRQNYSRGGDHDAVADFDYFRLTPLPPTSVDRQDDGTPHGYSLSQNYPNPFNPITQIRFGLPSPSHVNITIFNAAGQHILTLVDEEKTAGFHRIEFDASSLASGVYLYKMQAGKFTASKKLLVTK